MRRIRRADTLRDYRAPRFSAAALLRVLPGYLPILALYGWIALVPHAFGHEQIVWLVTMQFIVVEMMACGVAVLVGVGLARRSGTVPWYADPRDHRARTGPRDPAQVRAALVVLGLVLLVVAPGLVHNAYGDWQRSAAVAGAFLPRLLDAWRVSDRDPDQDPAPARALAHSGVLGWGMALLCLALVWMLAAVGAPVVMESDGEVPAWSRLAGAVIVLYYLGVALGGVWLEPRQLRRSAG